MTEKCEPLAVQDWDKVPVVLQTHLFEPLKVPAGQVKKREVLTVTDRAWLHLRNAHATASTPHARTHADKVRIHPRILSPNPSIRPTVRCIMITLYPMNVARLPCQHTARSQQTVRPTDTEACSEFPTGPTSQGSTDQSEAKNISSVGLGELDKF